MDPLAEPSQLQDPIPEPGNLRFLRILVTVLTAVMILGMITIVTLLVLRFNSAPSAGLVLPAEIQLPAGTQALAITVGPGWYAVVTTDQKMLVFATDGSLRQTVQIAAD